MNDKTNEHLREIGLDLGECHACQACAELNPEIFEWDETLDRPVVKKSHVTEEEVREAMSCCPKDCILFVDE
ncbi:ferredoxin [Pseudodesulfovibrio tunisiensis]|uniref:ferredoxin n=1 Tax=Pseudodesulfovibrio tunisiensis TaxID=463192 RepID=UPI001FB3330C|nr:ferredoxin [Pseudodesulfovibrio tunisiensis]